MCDIETSHSQITESPSQASATRDEGAKAPCTLDDFAGMLAQLAVRRSGAVTPEGHEGTRQPRGAPAGVGL